MSIRLKLLLGCLCLTMVTLLVGGFSQYSQRQIGDLAVTIYDDALVSTNALRAAQNAMIRLDARLRREHDAQDMSAPLSKAHADHVTSELRATVAELQIAREGAISPAGQSATGAVQRRLARLLASSTAVTPRLVFKELAMANEELDSAVRVFAADAHGVRTEVGGLVRASVERTWAAMGLAALFAVLISYVLSRTIVPALRNAMSIAKSIAGGNLDNQIVPIGRSETAELLAALSTMQDSIARHFGEVETRAAKEADRYDGEIATQGTRFEAALNNMTQGLCMFDGKGGLVVANLRFAEMFGPFEIGASMQNLAREPRLSGLLTLGGESFATREVDGGRMIAVSRQAIVSGGHIFTFEDVTERHRAARRLSYLASHDPLTDLPNRMQVRDRLESIAVDTLAERSVAVFCLDVDGFKFVNDTLGHPVGDLLLKAVGERLVAAAGRNQLVGRIGGDEFAIVQIDQTQPGAAEGLARRIIADLAMPFEIGNERISISVSIGIVVAANAIAEGGSAWGHALMKCADLALYEAKGKGRNTYCFFQPAMDERIQLRRSTEIDLIAALENDEFELYYQPFVDVARQTISGFEALIRWRHPTRGMVSPAEFIPIAEEAGLIDQIGLWVLKTACRQASGWPVDLNVSVNLSPLQFRKGTLFPDVKRVLAETGFDPQRLQMEVTENVLLSDTESVLAVLGNLRKLGISISMDDFGTGYSSLGYLSRFPFDKVKIDQSFVRDLAKRENLAVVRAVIGLSKAMGIAVIAEGVETREQRDILLAESCGEMQGYYFSEPRPVSDLPQFLMQFGAKARLEAVAQKKPGAAQAPEHRPGRIS